MCRTYLALGLLDGAGDALHGARVGGVLLLLGQLLEAVLRVRILVPQERLLLLRVRQLRGRGGAAVSMYLRLRSWLDVLAIRAWDDAALHWRRGVCCRCVPAATCT
jgi:hypothetical protein